MSTDNSCHPKFSVQVPPVLVQPPSAGHRLNSLTPRKSINNLNLKISTPVATSFNLGGPGTNTPLGSSFNLGGPGTNTPLGSSFNLGGPAANIPATSTTVPSSKMAISDSTANCDKIANSSTNSAAHLNWLAPPGSFAHHNENAQNLRKKISQSNLNNPNSRLSNQSVKLYSLSPSNPTSNAVAVSTPVPVLQSPISPPTHQNPSIPTNSTSNNSSTSPIKKKALLSLSIPDNHSSQQNVTSTVTAPANNYDDILSDKSSNYGDDNDMTSVLYSARVEGPTATFDSYNNNNNNNNIIIHNNNSMGSMPFHNQRSLPPTQSTQSRTFQSSFPGNSLNSSEFPEYEFKKNAYPNGPADIYKSLLYLYSEPKSFQEISEFDLVVNVAKEVVAPFDECPNIDSYLVSDDTAENLFKQVTEKEIIEEVLKDKVYKNEFANFEDTQSLNPDSSLIQKVSKSSCKIYKKTKKSANENEKTISYLYIPWSHTSKIFDNLPYLTSQIIYNFIRNNKKVLIHCQCGVSRSASLVIACIMKLENLNLTNAYNFVKTRAQDISPNMTLIFQLMEWGDFIGVGSSENKSPGEYYDPEFHKNRQLNDPSMTKDNNLTNHDEAVSERIQRLSISDNRAFLKTPHHLTFQFNDDDDHKNSEVKPSSNMFHNSNQNNLLAVPSKNSNLQPSTSNKNNMKKTFLTISSATANSGVNAGGEGPGYNGSKFTGYVKTPHYSRFQFNDNGEDDEDEDKDFDHNDEDENDVISPSAPSITLESSKNGKERNMEIPSISTFLDNNHISPEKNDSDICSPSEIGTADNAEATGIIEKLAVAFN